MGTGKGKKAYIPPQVVRVQLEPESSVLACSKILKILRRPFQCEPGGCRTPLRLS